MRVLIVTFWHYWFHVFALSCLTRLLQQENLWRHIFCNNCVSCFFFYDGHRGSVGTWKGCLLLGFVCH